jgi:hypothetical protein
MRLRRIVLLPLLLLAALLATGCEGGLIEDNRVSESVPAGNVPAKSPAGVNQQAVGAVTVPTPTTEPTLPAAAAPPPAPTGASAASGASGAPAPAAAPAAAPRPAPAVKSPR